MRPVLPKIIKSGQLCTVEKRNILFGVSNVLSTILDVHQKKSSACLISLDFFKAYDRLYLPFLLKVMQEMNFGDIFISWISMLHFKATTRLILSELTSEIEFLFSIRQGDPLAMILYIIYMEPFLITLESQLSGYKIGCPVQNSRSPSLSQFSISEDQKVEAFCEGIPPPMTDHHLKHSLTFSPGGVLHHCSCGY